MLGPATKRSAICSRCEPKDRLNQRAAMVGCAGSGRWRNGGNGPDSGCSYSQIRGKGARVDACFENRRISAPAHLFTPCPPKSIRGKAMSIRRTDQGPSRHIEVALAFAFGCVAIGVVLWLAFRSEAPLSDQQFELLRIVIALAGGGIGAVLPGLLRVDIEPSARLAMRAGGALALFLILYFWSPANSRPRGGPVVQQTGSGSFVSPAQNGDNNRVIIDGKP